MNALSASEQRLAADVLRFLVTPSGAIQRFTAVDLADYVNRANAEVEALAEKLSQSPARVLRSVETVRAMPGRTSSTSRRTRFSPGRSSSGGERYETAPRHRRRRLLLALAAVSAVALALVGYAVQPTALASLEFSTVDARFAIRGPQSPDRDIMLVTFGAATIAGSSLRARPRSRGKRSRAGSIRSRRRDHASSPATSTSPERRAVSVTRR